MCLDCEDQSPGCACNLKQPPSLWDLALEDPHIRPYSLLDSLGASSKAGNRILCQMTWEREYLAFSWRDAGNAAPEGKFGVEERYMGIILLHYIPCPLHAMSLLYASCGMITLMGQKLPNPRNKESEILVWAAQLRVSAQAPSQHIPLLVGNQSTPVMEAPSRATKV